MAYTIYAMGAASRFQDNDSKIGFWCYYLRTPGHSELQCDVIQDEEKVSAPKMELQAVIEALKVCKALKPNTSNTTVKIYTTNQQYFEQCFDRPESRKKNKDLWNKIDKLQIDKGLIGFPGDLDTNVKASRGMTIVKEALEDTKTHDHIWNANLAHPNLNKII